MNITCSVCVAESGARFAKLNGAYMGWRNELRSKVAKVLFGKPYNLAFVFTEILYETMTCCTRTSNTVFLLMLMNQRALLSSFHSPIMTLSERSVFHIEVLDG